MDKQYVVSGGASGIGAALVQKLRARGDRVISVDRRDADVIADLSSAGGLQAALQQIGALAPSGIDGLVPCAGLGPHVRPVSLIAQVNYFASVRLLEGLRPLLEMRRGTAVLVSSNSAALPGRHDAYAKALLAGDEAEACRILEPLDGQQAYGGSKYALAVWMRKQAPAWMRAGLRLNAVAPGITRSAMTDGVFADAQWGRAIQQFNAMTPAGDMASPPMIADAIVFLLDPASQFVCGSVLFVDGGTDALLRPDNF